MQSNNWKDNANNRKSLVDTGRKPIPLVKYPQDLDFTKTVGSTTYVVKSHFNPNADECLLAKVSRLFSDSKNLSE